MFVLIATLLLLVAHQGECVMNATVTLYANNLFQSYGSLVFTQEHAESPVQILGTISGLKSDSAHGFHIHVNPVSDGGPDCTAAGGHFNPYNKVHGPQTADIDNRHVGDLGNITTDAKGVATIDLKDSIIQLYNSTQSIVNRSVVVHKFRDDAGQGGFTDSNTTGNAGARLLCGLIVLSYEDPTTPAVTTTAAQTTTATETITAAQTTTATEITTAAQTTTAAETTTAAQTTTTIGNTTETPGNTTAVTTPSTGAHLQPVTFVFMIIMTITYVMIA